MYMSASVQISFNLFLCCYNFFAAVEGFDRLSSVGWNVVREYKVYSSLQSAMCVVAKLTLFMNKWTTKTTLSQTTNNHL